MIDPASQVGSARRNWAPYAILATSLVITLVAVSFVQQMSRQRERMRFEMMVDQTESALESQVRLNVNWLQGGVSLFAASGRVSKADFERYVTRLTQGRFFRSIQGIGYTERIPPAKREAVAAEMRASDPSFRFWNDDPQAELHAILYLEPLDTLNRRAIGYNMFSEPVRRSAMETARDTGRSATSGRVRLKQEGTEGRQNGYLIYAPVYRTGIVPATQEARRHELMGFVYSPFRMDDFVNETLKDNEIPHVRFDIWDGPTRTPDHVLYSSPATASKSPFVKDVIIEVPGRMWSARFETTQAFVSSAERGAGLLTLLGGLTISALLFGISMVQARSRTAAELAAARLQQSEETIRAREQDLQRLYAEAQNARATAEQANRLKDDFLATVSHELRTPLNAIMGYAQLLRLAPRGPRETARALEAIERNVKAQAQLIEDLLDVSRIISGKMRLDIQRVDIEQVIHRAAESVAPAVAAKELRLDVCVDPDARPMLGDPNRLQQVVWNLLSNAAKFTEAGGQIAVRAATVGNTMEIEVTDTGAGIAPEYLPHIFERFRQGDSTTTRGHGGLGLGLSIVRNIVEMHGGSISAESDGKGEGARFLVRLPLTGRGESPADPPAVPAIAAGSPRPPRAAENGPDLTGARILVVDDDPDARLLMGEILEAHGAEVRSVASAAEAYDAVPVFLPHVLLSDIAMPGEDGYSLIRRVRALPGEKGGAVPAAALTAFARSEDRNRALGAGFHMHIAKPIEPADLLMVVATLCGKG